MCLGLPMAFAICARYAQSFASQRVGIATRALLSFVFMIVSQQPVCCFYDLAKEGLTPDFSGVASCQMGQQQGAERSLTSYLRRERKGDHDMHMEASNNMDLFDQLFYFLTFMAALHCASEWLSGLHDLLHHISQRIFRAEYTPLGLRRSEMPTEKRRNLLDSLRRNPQPRNRFACAFVGLPIRAGSVCQIGNQNKSNDYPAWHALHSFFDSQG